MVGYVFLQICRCLCVQIGECVYKVVGMGLQIGVCLCVFMIEDSCPLVQERNRIGHESCPSRRYVRVYILRLYRVKLFLYS